MIRGLSSNTPAGAATEFGDLTLTMMGTRVTLTDIVKIPNNPELWRGKILDGEQRRFVLDRAKHLRGSQYDHIYIRRDLTYAQRMELKQRRESQGRAFTRAAPQSHTSTATTHHAAASAAAPAPTTSQLQTETSSSGADDKPGPQQRSPFLHRLRLLMHKLLTVGRLRPTSHQRRILVVVRQFQLQTLLPPHLGMIS